MATIADNILDLAMLVKDVKRKTQLSETTIMRVVDMSFALAQQGGPTNFSTPEIPEDTGDIIDIEDYGEVIEFPTPTPTDEA